LRDVMSCSVVQVYGHFKGSCSLVYHIPQDSNQHGHSSKTLKCHIVSYSFELPLRILHEKWLINSLLILWQNGIDMGDHKRCKMPNVKFHKLWDSIFLLLHTFYI
jgi:hypothetical protein